MSEGTETPSMAILNRHEGHDEQIAALSAALDDICIALSAALREIARLRSTTSLRSTPTPPGDLPHGGQDPLYNVGGCDPSLPSSSKIK